MILVLALAACGGPGNHTEGEVRPRPSAAPAPLHLRLEAPDTVRSGEPVPMRLVLENRGPQPVGVELEGRPVSFDFVVVAPEGSEVWSRLEGVAVADVLQLRTLGAGEAMEFSDAWRQRDHRGRAVAPGSYRVRGILPVAEVPGGWGTDFRTLTIVP